MDKQDIRFVVSRAKMGDDIECIAYRFVEEKGWSLFRASSEVREVLDNYEALV